MEKLFGSRLSRVAVVLASAWLVWYFGLSAAIMDKMWYTSPAIPVCGGIVAIVPLVLTVLNAFVIKKRPLDIVIVCLCPVLTFAHFVVFAFVISKLVYFFVAGKPYFITAGLAALLVFFIFVFPHLGRLLKRIFAIALSVVVAVICLVCCFCAVPFYLSGGATVFLAENDGRQEYQIAFATSVKSTGAVTVNGVTYYDKALGENNISKLHKISVPAKELDSAKSYSIRTQCVALNTAYLPTAGAVIEREYSFRPVDESDGLQIYSLSDTHECIAGPANAASYFGDKLDLLILNGDIINDVSTEYQISLIYKLAHRVTGGTRPVVFSRGNHECGGYLAADLSKYVGGSDRGFYYTLKVGSLSMLVLDTGSDVADDSALVRPISNFEKLRAEEAAWLKGLGDFSGESTYSMAVAHIAYPLSGYVSEKYVWHDWARELVALTENRAQLALCGHSHKTDFAAAGTTDNTAAFPVVRGSIRSNTYPDKEGISPFCFTGTALEFKDGKISVKFTNAKKQVLGEYIVEV